MCPSCGGKRLEGDQTAWCSICGSISCPKCKSFRVISGKIHSWEFPSLRCQICGHRIDLPMLEKSPRKEAKIPRLVKCSTPGCDKMVEARNSTGKCQKCFKAEKALAAMVRKTEYENAPVVKPSSYREKRERFERRDKK